MGSVGSFTSRIIGWGVLLAVILAGWLYLFNQVRENARLYERLETSQEALRQAQAASEARAKVDVAQEAERRKVGVSVAQKTQEFRNAVRENTRRTGEVRGPGQAQEGPSEGAGAPRGAGGTVGIDGVFYSAVRAGNALIESTR